VVGGQLAKLAFTCRVSVGGCPSDPGQAPDDAVSGLQWDDRVCAAMSDDGRPLHAGRT